VLDTFQLCPSEHNDFDIFFINLELAIVFGDRRSSILGPREERLKGIVEVVRDHFELQVPLAPFKLMKDRGQGAVFDDGAIAAIGGLGDDERFNA